MNLHRLLQQRASAGKPVRVGLIGAGKFGSMFLNQVPTMAGLEVSVIADLDPEGARNACRTVGWDAARIARTRFVASGAEACADPGVKVVIEATGSPPAGIAHARGAIAAGKHIVMVNVEADVLAGPLLAEEARAKGTAYSLAYGDQPALTCEIGLSYGRKPSRDSGDLCRLMVSLPEKNSAPPCWPKPATTPNPAALEHKQASSFFTLSKKKGLPSGSSAASERNTRGSPAASFSMGMTMATPVIAFGSL
jgi:hypothetical protein